MMKKWIFLVAVISLGLLPRISAQSPEEMRRWQTPAFELAVLMMEGITSGQELKNASVYTELESYLRDVIKQDPSNALLHYYAGMVQNHKMYHAHLVAGIENPIEGTSVNDAKLSMQEKLQLRAFYQVQEESFQQAEHNYLKSAELGFSGALIQLAHMLRSGHPVKGSLSKQGFTQWQEKTDPLVMDFLQRAAKMGSNEGKEQLASLYLRGEGEIKQDIKKGEEIARTVKDPADFYFRLASGFLSAKTKRDSATEFDYSLERGKEYMLKAAAMNQPDALYELALSYLRFPEAAPLTPEDHKLGYATMVKVATSAKEAPQAYFYLSQLLRQGKGTEKNLPKAIEMVEELAGQSSDAEEKEFLQKELSKMKAEL
ncbi:tetratricopeptide repeat protein [Planobacterium oryzisoli]|uniref:Sel1 repeat family protein n=1 Tax=Planobacterium oryzisoli TaxID=2771435 RepID=A0A930YV94_9FLAO|nr:sel1 repeat family protein [Planobacterium oryzisoli]MBF5026970.1 sel1 repeat family protein [Planobacterium oryzisoli]